MGTGYSHDAQCVIYHGPDGAYSGREICFGFNETHVTIADVTDKASPIAISAATYPNSRYIHQGWLSEDHKYLFQNDEQDESNVPEITNTRTLVWDVQDLDEPELVNEYIATTTETDHNLYVKGNLMYQSNYGAGLRILDISNPTEPVEVAYFDTSPVGSGGISWSNYPFYASGTVAIVDTEGGLFLVSPTMSEPVAVEEPVVPVSYAVTSAYPNPFTSRFTISVQIPDAQYVEITVFDVLGRLVETVYAGRLDADVSARFNVDLSEYRAGTYYYRISGDNFTVSKPIVLLK